MKLSLLGGASEIGRSALLVDDTLLLDFGMASGNPPQYPVETPSPAAVVASHGHLDHVGAIPMLLSGTDRPPVHWTPPTFDLAMVLAQDTLHLHGGSYDCPFTAAEISRLTAASVTHETGVPFEVAGYEVTLFDAGHIPGSCHVLVDDGETRLLYTGDFHTTDQRIVSASVDRPAADVVVTESTYADTERPERSSIEQSFVDAVRSTVWEGGTAVVPAFAIGRTQEVLATLAAHDVDCYVDGMGTRVTELLLQERNQGFLDAAELRRAAANARVVTGRDGQRRRIAAESTVIVTTSGMLTGGPAMTYVPEIYDHPKNAVVFTGFQVPGTPGRELLETGSATIDGTVLPVSAQVEQFDFSAHADRTGLESFLESYEDATVLVVHGERCSDFADDLRADGYDATAPAVGETVVV